MTDPMGNTYTYGYDLNGNRTSVTMPDGTSVSTAYDARGRITSQTDQHGNTTRYTYDGADRLTSVTDALGGKWKYSYNSVGELVAITDANGNTTKYEYDNGGRVIKTTNAAGDSATVTYDETDNVLTSTDYAGNVTTFAYDELDRVISKTVSGDTVTYSYRADGLLSSVTDRNGVTSYTYDIMNGLTSVTLYDGNTINYTYDDACRLTSVKTPFGTTKYSYDLMDRLVKVVAHDGTATLYEYDANGNRTAVRYANGMIVKYEYDTVNRLVLEKVLDKDANVVVQYTYTLGAAGERTKVVETGETELKTVLKVYVHSVDEILHLYTDEVNIDTTTNHPFYVIGKGWTAAGDLVEGDEVYNLDGTTSVVLGSVIEKLDECVLVYNLEVEDYHSYFVADNAVLVHNYNKTDNCDAFDIVDYGDKHPGYENHHGVMDAWAKENIPNYISRASSSPTIALTESQHNATNKVYRDWLRENYGKPVGVKVDWKNISPREIFKLSERMFDAAGVPITARNNYYSEFYRYIYGLG